MAEITEITKALFRKRQDWKYITDEDKIKYFFIFNRNFCKIFPEKAQLLNLKNIDKVAAFDAWFHFMKDRPYPECFWSKSAKNSKTQIEAKDYKTLLERLKIKDIDLDYLIDNHIEYIKQELKYFKQLEKGN